MSSYLRRMSPWKRRERKPVRVRIRIANLVKVARKVKSVRAAGSIPPQFRRLRLKMEQEGVSLQLYDRTRGGGEQQAPDMMLQWAMLNDLVDYPPGTAVLLTGDGAGYNVGVGFHSTLERLHRNCCRGIELGGLRMRSWVTGMECLYRWIFPRTINW